MITQDIFALERRTNLRAIADYFTSDGRKVVANRLFRSGELAQLNEDEIRYVHSLGLSFIMDFRSEQELEAKPNPVIEGATYVSIPAIGGSMNHNDMGKAIKAIADSSQSGSLLNGVYRMFIKDAASIKTYRRFIELAVEADGRPILFHCTAGKDRTGFASAILLFALGVPIEQIFEDYLRSNDNRIEQNEKMLQAIRPMFASEREFELIKEAMFVRSEYLQVAFEEAQDAYGSVERFLEEELGITPEMREQLQLNYLERE
jgi:protein-tyrosine phosphatase